MKNYPSTPGSSRLSKFAKGGKARKRFCVYLSSEASGENTDQPNYETDNYQDALNWARAKSNQSDPKKPEGFEYSDYDYVADVFDRASNQIVADFAHGEPNYVEKPANIVDEKYYMSSSKSGNFPVFGSRRVGLYHSGATGPTNDLMQIVAAYNRNANMDAVKSFMGSLSNERGIDDEPIPVSYQKHLKEYNAWAASTKENAATKRAAQMALRLWHMKPVRDVEMKDVHYAKGGEIGSSDKPMIYVADLAAYNEGKLEGDWLDLDDYSDADELLEAIDEKMKEWSEKAGVEREEWAVHDTENIPSGLFGEYPSKEDLEKYYEVKKVCDDRDIPIEVAIEWMSDHGADASNIEDAYQGEYDDEEDFAYRMIEDGVMSAEDYITMSDTDRRIISNEEADNQVDNMDDNELIDQAEMREEYDALEEEESDYEYDEEGEEEERDFDNEKEALIEKAKDKLRDEIGDRIYDELSDPVQYFVEDQGMYSKEDLAKQSFIMVDYQDAVSDLKHDYSFIRHDGKTYAFNDNY